MGDHPNNIMANRQFVRLTFPKNNEKGEPVVDFVRGGDPRFESEAKFLRRVNGEPDFRRVGVEYDVFIPFDAGLFFADTVFSFSAFSL